MEELIKAIFDITKSMEKALTEEKDQELESLLTERNFLMMKVDEYRIEHPDVPYSNEAKRLLEATLQIDRELAPILEQRLTETKASLNQIKMNKEVSKKYQPYMKQTNGMFIDSKK